MMPRDIKSEWLAALATVGLLAFAVTFGLLLSVSDTELEPTSVVDSRATNSPSPQSSEETVTVEMPSNTPTSEPTETDTPTNTMTNTVAPPTETLVSTRQVRPTRTRIPTRTPTETLVPVTETSTRPTRTPIPTRTATLSTAYIIVTLDFGIMPTPTTDEMQIAAFETAQADCGRPQGWVLYEVQPGDTLFLISLAVDSTVENLALANCLEDPAHITAGDRLFLPQYPRGVVGGVIGLSPEGCTSPAAQIINPLPGQRVTEDTVMIRGNAYLENLDFYKIEIRRDETETYNFLMSSHTLVLDDVLGMVNLASLEAGVYWLRLSLVDDTGNIPPDLTCAIPILIE